jgi:hypothetical protein
MPTQKFTAEIINAAIEGFESQKRHIDSQIDELRQLLSPDSPAATAESAEAPLRKRKISAAGRRRMALAQQARWAKARGEAVPSSSRVAPAKQKRQLSEAGRKAISDATKKRWALKRADAKKASSKKTPASKKAQPKGSEAGTPAA